MRKDASLGAARAWAPAPGAALASEAPPPARHPRHDATRRDVVEECHPDASREPPSPRAAGEPGSRDEEAFASVHDLVHYAILTAPARRATLKQIYHVCKTRGRIVTKHNVGSGSRHLTSNAHWKSQIRHALYTSPRFKRAEDGDDDWTSADARAKTPETTTVRVPAREIVDVSSAIVGDGRGRGRPPAKRDARGGGVPKKNGGGGTAKRDAGAGAADPGSGGPSAACEKSKPAASSGSLGGWEGPPLGLKSSSTALAAPLGFVVGGGTKRERKGDEVTSPAAEKTRRRRAKGALENRRARDGSPRETDGAEFATTHAETSDEKLAADERVPALVSRCATPDRGEDATSSPREGPRAAPPRSATGKRIPARRGGASPDDPSAFARARVPRSRGAVTVMVGDVAVVPAGRDATGHRRKRLAPRRAAMPRGSVVHHSPAKPPGAFSELDRQVSSAFVTYHVEHPKELPKLRKGLSLQSHEGESPGTWIRGLLESQQGA